MLGTAVQEGALLPTENTSLCSPGNTEGPNQAASPRPSTALQKGAELAVCVTGDGIEVCTLARDQTHNLGMHSD